MRGTDLFKVRRVDGALHGLDRLPEDTQADDVHTQRLQQLEISLDMCKVCARVV